MLRMHGARCSQSLHRGISLKLYGARFVHAACRRHHAKPVHTRQPCVTPAVNDSLYNGGGRDGNTGSSGGDGTGWPGGSGPQPQPGPDPRPMWLKVWLWACVLAYLVARKVWRARLHERVAQFERDTADAARQEEEWSRFVEQQQRAGGAATGAEGGRR